MKQHLISVLSLLFVGVTAIPCPAQHADLAPAEVDQLRDSMMEADTRLKLFVKFARARLDALNQVRTDPKITAAERPAQTHEKLQDFVDIYDDRKDDIRKPLKVVIEADAEFQARIKAFQDSLAAAKEDTKPFEFVLSN